MDKKIFAGFLAVIFSFVLLPGVAGAACNLVAGTSYYTDGVSKFSDSGCHNEIIGNGTGTVTQTQTSGASGYIPTGSANCRYSLAKEQYTDGVSFFTDSKCQNEALNDQTVPAPTAMAMATAAQTSAAMQTVAATQTSAIAQTASASLAQANQRIALLESKINILASMISQILALLAQR